MADSGPWGGGHRRGVCWTWNPAHHSVRRECDSADHIGKTNRVGLELDATREHQNGGLDVVADHPKPDPTEYGNLVDKMVATVAAWPAEYRRSVDVHSIQHQPVTHA